MLVFADPFGDAPRIAVVALSVFFMMTIHTMGAVQNVEGIYILAGRNYGAHGLKLFFKVILPGSLPSIFSGMRVALGMALIVIIAVEFLRAEKGVGYLIYYNWEILAPEKMYAGLITVMLIGILTTLVLKLLQYLALPWKRHSLFK
jgi:ABC-type nitrate/sulfonate/bicarbonate transport system permease component